jgi:hypothetical protein
LEYLVQHSEIEGVAVPCTRRYIVNNRAVLPKHNGKSFYEVEMDRHCADLVRDFKSDVPFEIVIGNVRGADIVVPAVDAFLLITAQYASFRVRLYPPEDASTFSLQYVSVCFRVDSKTRMDLPHHSFQYKGFTYERGFVRLTPRSPSFVDFKFVSRILEKVRNSLARQHQPPEKASRRSYKFKMGFEMPTDIQHSEGTIYDLFRGDRNRGMSVIETKRYDVKEIGVLSVDATGRRFHQVEIERLHALTEFESDVPFEILIGSDVARGEDVDTILPFAATYTSLQYRFYLEPDTTTFFLKAKCIRFTGSFADSTAPSLHYKGIGYINGLAFIHDTKLLSYHP